MLLFVAAIIVFLLNLPFGYWRSRVNKYSFQWFLAVHLPVILVILIRIYGDIGFALITYPILVISFFLGQFTGGKANRLIKKQ